MSRVKQLRLLTLAMAVVFSSLLILSAGCARIRAVEDNVNLPPNPTTSMTGSLPIGEVPVRMLFPHGTKTVDEAVSYMLEPHSYHPEHTNSASNFIAQRRFINNFGFEPVPLYIAMERLMGHGSRIILDENRMLYTFQVRNPGQTSVAYTDLTVTPGTATESAPMIDEPALRERPGTNVINPEENRPPVNEPVLHVADNSAGDTKTEDMPAEYREFCDSIQFSKQTMLSVTVQEYFLRCGFDKVSWGLGEPGRYADYQLLQNINLPLPERHHDLIEYLQSRFGIKTLIHDDKLVEFYDESHTL